MVLIFETAITFNRAEGRGAMEVFRPGQARRWLVGALFALLACVLSAPPAAGAGCGRALDWSGGPDYLEALAHAGALAPATDAASADLPKESSPCPGGICSRGPNTPPTPTLSLNGPAPQWAVLMERPAQFTSEPALLPRDEAARRPTHHGRSLFHPPRPS